MQNDKPLDSKSFSVPKGMQEATKRATLRTTLSQIANADLMIRMYKDLANREADKDKRGKYSLKAQQLEDGKEINFALLRSLNYRAGDEKEPFLAKLISLFF